MTPATVNYHFAGKDELYHAAWVAAVDSIYAAYADAIAGCDTVADELAALCDCNLQILLWGSSMVGLSNDVNRAECNHAIRTMLAEKDPSPADRTGPRSFRTGP